MHIIELIINVADFSQVVDNLPNKQTEKIEALDERFIESNWLPSPQEQEEIREKATAAIMKMLLEKQSANQPIEVPDLLRSVKDMLEERGRRPEFRLEAYNMISLT